VRSETRYSGLWVQIQAQARRNIAIWAITVGTGIAPFRTTMPAT
jgi:hypothetical protein